MRVYLDRVACPDREDGAAKPGSDTAVVAEGTILEMGERVCLR